MVTAIVTGGNTGVGWWIAFRLLEHERERHGGGTSTAHVDLTLACRSLDKAARARDELRAAFPDARIALLQVDLSRPASVRAACAEYRKTHDRLDLLFANAGVMPVRRVNWLALVEHVIRGEFALFFETSGRFLEQPVDARTPDGLGEVFASNVFGHYLMIRLLEEQLAGGGRVFWTGSSSSNDSYFDMDDFQGFKTAYPYQASKYAADLISHALNLEYNRKGIYSLNTAPGTMITGIATSQFPEWMFALVMPLMVLFRLVTENLTLTGYNAVESMITQLDKDASTIDLRRQYVSCTSFTGSRIDGTGGQRSVQERELHLPDEDARELKRRIDELAKPYLA